MEKHEVFEKIAEVFDIKSVDDLVYKMPFITTHDIQCFGIDGRELYSDYKSINPKETYLAVYEKIKGLKKSEFKEYFNEDLRTKEFHASFQAKDYSPLVVTCHHQAQFLADFINYYLSEKDNSLSINPERFCLEGVLKEKAKKICSDKATIINVDLYLDGKRAFGHYIVGYKGKLLECSHNIKLADDVANIPWNEDSFDKEKIKEKAGWNYHILGTDYPVCEDWLTWGNNINTEKRLEAKLALENWKEKRI